MGPNTFGSFFRIVTFGESHGPALGVVLDGVMPGLPLDLEIIRTELHRRRPGQSRVSSPRKEPDELEILSGIVEGLTTGAPICLIIRNRDVNSESYRAIENLFRPGHADFTLLSKYGIRDFRGGGRLSGRETVARVASGAIARQILRKRKVELIGFVRKAGTVEADLGRLERALDQSPDRARALVEANPMRCPDPSAAEAMEKLVLETAAREDSVGGVVEVRAFGVPPGWGDPVFWKLDAKLAQALMSIGAVKGVEIGSGFAAASMLGSENNDPISPEGFTSNHAGGVLGGISSGQPIVARIAVKPTPSIGKSQKTIDRDGRPAKIRVKGRHDPCICPRIVPVAEAMTAITLADAMLRQNALAQREASPGEKKLAVERATDDLLLAARRLHELTPSAASGDEPPSDILDRETFSKKARAAGLPDRWAENLFQAISPPAEDRP